MPASLLAVGCAMGPSPETLVDELRVLHIDAPPEVLPGELAPVQAVVVEPEAAPYEVAVWSCTRGPEGCIEATGAGWATPVARGDASGESLLAHLTDVAVNPALAGFVDEEPIPLLSLFALACAPGVCPLFEVEPGSADEEALLADPFAMLQDLPMEGVSLATRTLSVSTRADGERHANPDEVSCKLDGELSEVDGGRRVPLKCRARGAFDGEAAFYGYSLVGGWEGQSSAIGAADGAVSIPYAWVAPPEDPKPSEGEPAVWPEPLLVVAVDGLGGVGLGQHSISIDGELVTLSPLTLTGRWLSR
jgi:hypothetical protein